jgi:hypothetical protein
MKWALSVANLISSVCVPPVRDCAALHDVCANYDRGLAVVLYGGHSIQKLHKREGIPLVFFSVGGPVSHWSVMATTYRQGYAE